MTEDTRLDARDAADSQGTWDGARVWAADGRLDREDSAVNPFFYGDNLNSKVTVPLR